MELKNALDDAAAGLAGQERGHAARPGALPSRSTSFAALSIVGQAASSSVRPSVTANWLAADASCARYGQGGLVGGTRGAELQAAARADLEGQDVAEAQRWGALIAPGFDVIA